MWSFPSEYVPNKSIRASIMSSATLVVYTLGQKRFKTKEPRDSRQPVIVLSGRKWPIR
jgi:hypothetical protein